jgi:catechol 2,3-dioxygenase-like lactoylglutathione lyase family enzyme
MKRFHVHVSVDDLDANIRFYSTVFGLPPAVQKDDYAKWMLDDPRVNFAISRRGARPGLDHLGVQVDSDEELAVLRAQAERAEIAALDQTGAACCYARSDKYWITDPQGIAWETFHTLDEIPVFGADSRSEPADTGEACCAPSASVAPVAVALPAKPAGKSACCG